MGTSPTVDSVEKAALGLSRAAALKLTRALVDSLAGLSETDINQLWLDEAERRDDDFESGRIKGAPGAEVMGRIRARHR